MTGSKDLLNQRLSYFNDLYASMRPKNIVTIADTYSYKWEDPSVTFPPPASLTVRGFVYYFAEPIGADNNPTVPQQWQLMSTGISLADSQSAYANCINLVSGSSDCLTLTAPDKANKYDRDISLFAQSASYWGGGAGPAGAPFVSVEAELPYKIGVVAGYFCQFGAVPTVRVSNFLKRGAGDVCAAFSYPFIRGYIKRYYRTINQTRFKFIDFSEIFFTMTNWLATAMTKSYDKGNTFDAFLPIPLGAFIGALRMSVMRMFFDSQCIGQFQTYDTNGGFEGFRLGTNCVPRTDKTLYAPTFLVENLRMLLPQLYENKTERYHNDRNCIVYIPVIGLPTAGQDFWNNIDFTRNGNLIPLFTDADGNSGINWIDGTKSGNIINLSSAYFQAGILAWNALVSQFADTAGTTSEFDGSPSDKSLLTITRYFNDTGFGREGGPSSTGLVDYPDWAPLPSGVKKVVRQKSKKVGDKGKSESVIEVVFNQGSSHLSNEAVVGVSSLHSISADLLGVIPSLILPKIRIAGDGQSLGGSVVQKYQTSYREHYFYRELLSTDTTLNPNNRASNIQVVAELMAPGIAKDASSEIERDLIRMQKLGEGGLLAQALGMLGGIAEGFGL